MDTKELHIVTRAEVEQQAVDLREEGINYAADMLLALLEAKEAAEKETTHVRQRWEATSLELAADRAELANARRAIERKDAALFKYVESDIGGGGPPWEGGVLGLVKMGQAAIAYTGTAPLAGDGGGDA